MDPEPAEQGLRQAQRDVSVILHVFQCSMYFGDDSGRLAAASFAIGVQGRGTSQPSVYLEV